MEQHDHNHEGNQAVVAYFIGLIAFIIALFTKDLVQNTFYILSVLMSGYHIVIEGVEDTITNTKLKKKFYPNVHILMSLAAIGAILIGNFEEAALLILIFAGAHFLEEYAEERSKKEITNLLKLNPTQAQLIKVDGTTEIVSVDSLKIGDKLLVINGAQIPTDGIIIDGYATIDESSINGESIPREKMSGDLVYGSTINGNSSFKMEVSKNSDETVFAKILQLVEQSQTSLSPTATFIQKVEPVYVKVVLVIFPLFITLTPLIFGWSYGTSFYRGIVLLISASPCALAASAVPASLSAISNLAKEGVLFKGGSYLANLADIEAVAFDKTGTLTKGKPEVSDFYFIEDINQQDVLDVVVAMEKTANHPLAQAIINKFEVSVDIDVEVINKIGQGLSTTYQNHQYKIGKANAKSDENNKIKELQATYALQGKSVVHVYIDERVVGIIAMMDIPNDEAISVIKYLKSKNVHTIMVTGDAIKTGQAIGDIVKVDEVIGDVLPENKAQIIQELQAKYGMVAMLGDGVNDAPALVQANIGVAMGDGSDVAIDVADAVLMQNSLSKFSYAHQVSVRLNRVVKENIIFSMAVVLLLVVLNIIGKMDITLGVIAHEGSTIVVILNGLRLLRK